MGDVHEVIPTTKSLSTLNEVTGLCRAILDSSFSFEMKSDRAYDINVNFTCDFNHSKTVKLVSMSLLVNYELRPQVSAKTVDFLIGNVGQKPIFKEVEGYEIRYAELAEFMVAETVKMVTSSKVLGSGYKVIPRKLPNYIVRDKYLFLYDAAYTPTSSRPKALEE